MFKPHQFMLNLSILAFVIQSYMQYIILFLNFEKFEVYIEFKFINTRMEQKSLTLKIQI